MSSIHTWSTLVWGSRNLAVWSPNGSGSTFFPRSRYLTSLFAPWPFSLSLYHLPDTSLVLNKLQKSIKTEKEGEEKVKKPRFPSILGPQRRPSRIEAASGELGYWISQNYDTTSKASSNFDAIFLCIQWVKPWTVALGLRSSCLSLHWGQVSTWKAVV